MAQKEATVAELYQRAIQELFSIQSLNGGDLPLYDRALLEQEPDRVVVETAGGVGYEVFVAPRLMMELPPAGEEVTLFVHTQVREDAITLYGFADRTDRAVFRLVPWPSWARPTPRPWPAPSPGRT